MFLVHRKTQDKRTYFCGVDSMISTNIPKKKDCSYFIGTALQRKNSPRAKIHTEFSYIVQDVTTVEKKETSKKVIKWYLQPKPWLQKTFRSEKRHFNVNTKLE